MNTLEGGIKGMSPNFKSKLQDSTKTKLNLGLPQRSPFVRTDCTVKHDGELYVVGAVKGVEQMSLYKTDREEWAAKKIAIHKPILKQFLPNKPISEIFIQLDAHRANHVET